MALTHEEYYGSPASRWRSKRFRRFLLPMLKEVRAARGRLRILDVGGTSQYWRPYQAELRTLDAAITLLNLQQLDDIRNENFRHGSATDVPFPDGAFDLVHSNSVIEHVGPWLQMLKAAAEIRRLANAYYVQTPNFWFPVEPHFRAPLLHFLPEQLRARLVMRLRLGFAKTRSATSQMLCFRSKMQSFWTAGSLQPSFQMPKSLTKDSSDSPNH